MAPRLAGVAQRELLRLTQPERLARTRERILDATLDCLAERGYQGTSFPEVLRRADLSNGALWRHFRSRADLLAAALLHSERRLASSMAAPDGGLDAAVDALWDYFHRPEVQALIELLFASRHDADLRLALQATDRDAARIYFDWLAGLLGAELAERPNFEAAARALTLALYGTAVTAGLRSAQAAEQLREEIRQLARELFR